MIERTVTIINRSGLHTRPAATLVKAAAKYASDFYNAKGGFEINGKSIIGVMTLAAEFGASLKLIFDGEDETSAAEEITKLFEAGFGEL